MSKTMYTRDMLSERLIPFKRLSGITCDKGKFVIKHLLENHPDDAFYNDILVVRQYAVFRYDEPMNCWTQVSNWYQNYANAERKLLALTDERPQMRFYAKNK